MKKYFKKTWENNIWKFFIFSLSQRRNFIPLLSIYFLTLPNTHANQIGLYTGLWFLASFLLEVPSGYFSDTFWHKSTLILSKLATLFSLVFFIFAWENSLMFFIIGSISSAIWIAFESGTKQAFLHSTLEKMGKENDYIKIRAKIAAYVSLVSMFFIIWLPFLTTIDILAPFKVGVIIDIIGLIVVMSLKDTNNALIKQERKSIKSIAYESYTIWFLPFALFTGSITAFCTVSSPYRSVYLEELWYPIILIGFVMGLSRFIWFIIWNIIHIFERNLSFKQFFLIDMIIFPFHFLLAAYFSNPYFVWIIFSLAVWYLWARSAVIENFIVKRYMVNKNYKATLISFQGQITLIIKIILSFVLSFLMSYSYKLGYTVLWVGLFFLLVYLFPRFIWKQERKS